MPPPLHQIAFAMACNAGGTSELSNMQASRLAENLAKQVTDGVTDSPEFLHGLRCYHAYQQQQLAAGKNTRDGKYSAKLAPFLAALPKEQRALGLFIAAEHVDTREHIAAEVARQLAPVTRDTAELCRRAQGDVPEMREGQTASQRKAVLDDVLANVPALRKERKLMAEAARQDAKDARQKEKDQRAATRALTPAREAAAKRPHLAEAVATSCGSPAEATAATRPVSSDSPPPRPCDAGCTPSDPQEPTREQLVGMIRAGLRRAGCEGALTAQQSQDFLRWAEDRLASGDPYEVTMAGRSPHKLHHLKLMFGIPDEDGMLPIYNFGILKTVWRSVAPMPELLRERAKQVGANSCVINFYADGAAYIAFHQDQRFSEGSGRYESKSSVVIDRVGAARDLAFCALDDTDLDRIRMQHGDSYTLSGPLNVLVKHGALREDACGLCVTFSWRDVRNRVSPDGKFAVVNGKRELLPEPAPSAAAAGSGEATVSPAEPPKRRRKAKGGREAGAADRVSEAIPSTRPEPSAAAAGSGEATVSTAEPPKRRRKAKGDRANHPEPEAEPASECTRGLVFTSPILGWGMLHGRKLVERRSFPVKPGWIWVYITGQKNSKFSSIALEIDPGLPSEQVLGEAPLGAFVGLIRLGKGRSLAQCNGYPFALPAAHGDNRKYYFYEILETIPLTCPVSMENKHPGGSSNRTWWKFLDEQLDTLRGALPSGPAQVIDLSPLRPAEAEHTTIALPEAGAEHIAMRGDDGGDAALAAHKAMTFYDALGRPLAPPTSRSAAPSRRRR